jgi:hypothetical protein
MLELFRNKKFISGFALPTLFLFGATVGSAFAATSDQRLSYKTKLRDDLDGDHIPETVTIRQHGSMYQVVVHFTTGRPKLRLRTYVTEDIAGLTVETKDLANSAGVDLVILSATSFRPVAVWLNEGEGKFKRVGPWTYGLSGVEAGPILKSRSEKEPEPVGNLLNNSLPQAETTDSTRFGSESRFLLTPHPGTSAFETVRRQVSPRGPPPSSLLASTSVATN